MISHLALIAIAERLMDRAIESIEPVRGGGNNEIFRLFSGGESFALKRYTPTALDPRDRLGHEFEALTFLAARGEGSVPRPIVADRAAGLAIYEWVVGNAVERLAESDVGALLAFLGRLHMSRLDRRSAAISAAIEACTLPGALHDQITQRLAQLSAISVDEPALRALLAERFVPAWRQLGAFADRTILARERQTLSPSDMGRHNMLRRADNSLVFLDFEYFGWDDPVKLVADVVWHPGSRFSSAECAQLLAGSRAIYADDPDFGSRLERRLPAFGLRWALIVLAEFIPERWERRQRAGHKENWSAVKARQLAKAGDFIERALFAVPA